MLWPLLYLPNIERIKASGKLTEAIEKELNVTWLLTQRFANLLDVEVDRIEPLQLIKYKTGEFYKKHHDHGGNYDFKVTYLSSLIFLSL